MAFQNLNSLTTSITASNSVKVSAMGAAARAPSRPKKFESINASGIRKNACLDNEINHDFTGFPIAWKNDAVDIGGP